MAAGSEQSGLVKVERRGDLARLLVRGANGKRTHATLTPLELLEHVETCVALLRKMEGQR